MVDELSDERKRRHVHPTTEAECVRELEGFLAGHFKTFREVNVRHTNGKLLRIDLLAIQGEIVIGFEVKAPGFKLAWALRQARDYVLSESVAGTVLACFVYPGPNLKEEKHDWSRGYQQGMAKLASYDRVGLAFFVPYHNGLLLDCGGHAVWRCGEWTSVAHDLLEGKRQFGGTKQNIQINGVTGLPRQKWPEEETGFIEEEGV
jgi:hypothetical protein